MKKFTSTFLSLLTLTLAHIALAKDTSTLDLVVSPKSQKKGQHAQVTITNELSGVSRHGVTNKHGHVSFYKLDTGAYTVEVKNGQETSIDTITIELGSNAFTLKQNNKTQSTLVKSLDFKNATITSREDVGEQELYYPYNYKQNLNSHITEMPTVIAADKDFTQSGTYTGVPLLEGPLPIITGASIIESQYRANGIDIESLTAHFLPETPNNLPFNAINQVQMISAGAPIIYDGAMGGYIETDLKKGSKSEKTTVTTHLEPHAFTIHAYQDPTYSFNDDGQIYTAENNQHKQSIYDLSVEMSKKIKNGYIYLGVYQPWTTLYSTIDTHVISGTNHKYDWDVSQADTNYATRLDYYPSIWRKQHHIQAFYFTDNKKYKGDVVDTGTIETGRILNTYLDTKENNNFGFNIDTTLNDNLQTSLQLSHVSSARSARSTSTTPVVMDDIDTAGPYASHAPGQTSFYHNIESYYNDLWAALDYHDVFWHTDLSVYTGKVKYQLNDETIGGSLYTYYSFYGVLQNEIWAYSQDASIYHSGIIMNNDWDFNRIQAQLGYRLDRKKLVQDNPEVTRYNLRDNPTYRINLTYNPSQNGDIKYFIASGTTKGDYKFSYTNWGSKGLQSFIPLSSSENESLYAIKQAKGIITYQDLNDLDLTTDDRNYFVYRYADSEAGKYFNHATNLKPPKQDEFLLGIEKNIADWNVKTYYNLKTLTRGVTYSLYDVSFTESYNIDTKSYSYAEDYGRYATFNPPAPLHVVNRTYPAGATFDSVQVTTNTIDKNPDLSPKSSGDDYVYTTEVTKKPFPLMKKTFSGLTLSLEKPWDGKTALLGHLTLSETRGNTPGAWDSTGGISSPYYKTQYNTQPFDPFNKGYDYGYLPTHRGINAKLLMRKALTEQIQGSSIINIVSPRQFSCIGLHGASIPGNDSYEVGGANSHSEDFYCNGNPMQRGTAFEGDWITNINVMFTYEAKRLPIWHHPMVKGVTSYISINNLTQQDSVVDRIEKEGDYFLQPSYIHLPSKVSIGSKITL